jgi:hypothetical protein
MEGRLAGAVCNTLAGDNKSTLCRRDLLDEGLLKRVVLLAHLYDVVHQAGQDLADDPANVVAITTRLWEVTVEVDEIRTVWGAG